MSSALTPPERQRRLDVARTVAREAGAVAMARFRDRAGLEVSTKTGGVYDTVSEVDRAVESLIRRRLMAAFPEDRCLGEEGGADPDAAHAHCLWVIDPIDGTDCFVNGIPVWSVSLALLSRGAVHAGVVYDPNAGELFAMAMGEGAFLDGEPVTPSPATQLAEGVLGVGISHRVPPEPTLELMGRLLAVGGIYQRNGSGALMLAYVAAASRLLRAAHQFLGRARRYRSRPRVRRLDQRLPRRRRVARRQRDHRLRTGPRRQHAGSRSRLTCVWRISVQAATGRWYKPLQ